MSVANTQREMAASIPSPAGELAGGPRCGAGMDGGAGNARIERRGNGRSGDSALDLLMRLPALVALERLPVPTLAVARDGLAAAEDQWLRLELLREEIEAAEPRY